MTRIKIKNENGEWETMPIIKGEPGEKGIPGEKGEKGDESYPIGTIVEYDGDTIPSGFELVEDNSASVIVSSTEPTTGEEVWIQKGKNLFDGVKNSGLLDDNGVIIANSDWFTSNFIKVSGSKKYTLSFDSTSNQQWKVCYYTKENTLISFQYGDVSGNSVIELTTPSNCSKIRFGMRSNLNHSNVQLEQGDRTPYEPFTPKKIYTKNDNDVYEEFCNEEENNNYNYSEQRIGTWLDKPLYRKVITHNITAKDTQESVNHNIENLKNIVSFGGYFRNEFNYDMPLLDEVSIFGEYTTVYMQSKQYKGTCYIILEYTKTTD